MASEIDICNLALSHIGGGTITSLSNPVNKEQRQCALLYPFARDAVLEDHNWGFAKKILTLAVLADVTYLDWEYAYAYPSDCLLLREIYDADNTKPGESKIEYDITTNIIKDNQIILTNEESAVGIFTAKVTNVNLYSSLFIESLSYRLAAALAIPVKGKEKLKISNLRDYGLSIGRAEANNANQSNKTPTDSNDFTKARL